MTGLLSRAAGWLVEPRDATDETAASLAPSAAAPPAPGESPLAGTPPARRFLPPVASGDESPAIHRATVETEGNPALAAVRTLDPGLETPRSPRRRGRSTPPDEQRSADADNQAVAPRAVALGPAADAPVVAAALALALCRSRRAPAALVFLRCAGDSRLPSGTTLAPGFPAARRLAARLGRRRIGAAAHGRLVWVPLPGDRAEASTVVARAEAAAGDVPSVVAVAGPRDTAADALIADRSPVVIAGDPGSPLATLAAADLRVPVRAWTPPPAGAGRLAILAGVRTTAHRAQPSDAAADDGREDGALEAAAAQVVPAARRYR
jgi:hypothetical protein